MLNAVVFRRKLKLRTHSNPGPTLPAASTSLRAGGHLLVQLPGVAGDLCCLVFLLPDAVSGLHPSTDLTWDDGVSPEGDGLPAVRALLQPALFHTLLFFLFVRV